MIGASTMASKLSTCFISHGWIGLNSNNSTFYSTVFVNHTSRRLLPASCKKRQRNLSSQNKRQLVKKIPDELSQVDAKLQPNGEADGDSETASVNGLSSMRQDVIPNNDIDNSMITQQVEENSLDGMTKSMNLIDKEQLSSTQFQDLINMIRNAEKNVLLLNQARVQALEDLGNIIHEKETLQGEISALELKLAETDASINVSTQEKIYIQLLEEQLEKMRRELSERVTTQEGMAGISGTEELQPWSNDLYNLNKELSLLKAENISLKDDLTAFKKDLNNVSLTDEQVGILGKERSHLESTVKDLESKLATSQEDLAKISTHGYEYNSLLEEVQNLQVLLDNATKQADQAILVLHQNQELRKKVDKLEETLAEANVYKTSSEKIQQYNEVMQQKIQLLEERLGRSDEEIDSYIHLYKESMKEFQDTLNTLQEEGKTRVIDGPVDDMPWEFWSKMLLMVDGWLLEKKVSSSDAEVLRKMVWKRERLIFDAYTASKQKTQREMLSQFLSLTSTPTRSALHVIHIAAEMAPVAKVGGLGDVVSGLGKALQKKGHLVEIILPKYDCMNYDHIHDLRSLDVEVESYFDGHLFKNKIWVGTVEGLPVYFIEPHHPAKLFWRGQYYGEGDDFKRFSFFSRAALELLYQSGKKPDIIHCHDWQTAFVAPLYWDVYAPKGLNSARICFTCHNFEYQGAAPAPELSACGLDVYQLNRPDRMQDNSAKDRINPVKGAIVFSNIVTTVSPTYAQEVRTPEFGRGLQTTIDTHTRKFIGILNGIDTDTWNPGTDSFIEVQYTASDLQGKAVNKEALRKHLGLSSADPGLPLIGCITRLVPQKGVHLIRHAIYRTLELGGQFVLLGSSPVPHIQREFEGIARQFQNHDNARLILKYDESLSHSIYAASNIFIIPSIFEPCGLTQMIAMRYGSIPVVRKTGGLNDSVFDVDDGTIPVQFRNGFTFSSPDEQGLNSALDRAVHQYKRNREEWEELVEKVMSMDFSWDSSATQYEELYAKSLAKARAPKRA